VVLDVRVRDVCHDSVKRACVNAGRAYRPHATSIGATAGGAPRAADVRAPGWGYDMIGERERVQNERPARRPIRPSQPQSMAALRPSQRRAAEHRATRDHERVVEHWLRRLARL
jgi:hypothetical protein